jgi:DNA-binding transcriptional ArsR family regulator
MSLDGLESDAPDPTALDLTLAALADPARRRMVDLLRQGPLRPGDLAARVALNRPAISKHLRVLRDCCLIEEIRAEGDDARARLYRLRADPFDDLAGWLEQVRTYWAGQLDAFAAHVEAHAPTGGTP